MLVFKIFELSYKTPWMKRRKTINRKLFAKLEATVSEKAINNGKINIILRHSVPAKNPQIWDVKITPMYPIALKTPLFLEPRSHSATESTKFIDVSSMKAQDRRPPSKSDQQVIKFSEATFSTCFLKMHDAFSFLHVVFRSALRSFLACIKIFVIRDMFREVIPNVNKNF